MTRAEARWRIRDHAEYHHLHEPRAVLISEALDVALESMDIADKYEEVLGDGEKLLAVYAKADKFDKLLADMKAMIAVVKERISCSGSLQDVIENGEFECGKSTAYAVSVDMLEEEVKKYE